MSIILILATALRDFFPLKKNLKHKTINGLIKVTQYYNTPIARELNLTGTISFKIIDFNSNNNNATVFDSVQSKNSYIRLLS